MAPCQRLPCPQTQLRRRWTLKRESQLHEKLSASFSPGVEELGSASCRERGLTLRPCASVAAMAAIPQWAGLGAGAPCYVLSPLFCGSTH